MFDKQDNWECRAIRQLCRSGNKPASPPTYNGVWPGKKSEDRSELYSPKQGLFIMSVVQEAKQCLELSKCQRTPQGDEAYPFFPSDSDWIGLYEQRPDSIFRYYSLENEVLFLRSREALSLTQKQYYVEENVKRFLGEFVGHIPYTTVSYELSADGFTYAGIPVRSSYQNAALFGTERERAETQGFVQIEDVLRFSHNNPGDNPSGAVWISPPKTADYGFVFVFTPDKMGKVKEYVLRYDESRQSLHRSSALFSSLSSSSPPTDSDAFLRHPLFIPTSSRQDLEVVMRQMGITDEQITLSRMFEDSVEQTLRPWIETFTSIVCQLPLYEEDSPYFKQGLLQAKKALLALYKEAERIQKGEHKERMTPTTLCADDLFVQMANLHLGHEDLPIALQGSCPSVRRNEGGLPDNTVTFMSNAQMLRSLAQGTPIEQTLKNREGTLDCTCPFCNKKVTALIKDKKITCPKCGESAPYEC